MKEGKLKEYIDSIVPDIKQMILSDNYSLDYYISSIESMINAKTSLQDRRFANLLSYNISVKTFNDEYGFSYASFIHGSYEHYVAEAFVYALMSFFKMFDEYKPGYKSKVKYLDKMNVCLSKLYPSGLYNKDVHITIYEINRFCNDRNIDLEYYVNLLLGHYKIIETAGLNFKYNIKDNYATKQQSTKSDLQ